MKKEERYCIDCGRLGVKERHRCEECAKAYNRQRAKKYGRRVKKDHVYIVGMK